MEKLQVVQWRLLTFLLIPNFHRFTLERPELQSRLLVSDEKFVVSNEKIGVSYERIMVSNENLGISNEHPGVSNKKIGVSEENMGVFDETVMGVSVEKGGGFSDSTPIMMISSPTPSLD